MGLWCFVCPSVRLGLGNATLSYTFSCVCIHYGCPPAVDPKVIEPIRGEACDSSEVKLATPIDFRIFQNPIKPALLH